MTLISQPAPSPGAEGAFAETSAASCSTSVVVADFQRFAAGGRLSEQLTQSLPAGVVQLVDPLPALRDPRRAADLTGVVDGGIDALPLATRAPLTIVADCGAAAVGIRIAQRLAPQRRCRLVLVKPTWPTPADVAQQFREFQLELGSTPTACPDLHAPAAALHEMRATLRNAMRVATGGFAGPVPEVLDELLGGYGSWLSYLLAAAQFLLTRPHLPAHVEPVVVVAPRDRQHLPVPTTIEPSLVHIQPSSSAELANVVASLCLDDGNTKMRGEVQ